MAEGEGGEEEEEEAVEIPRTPEPREWVCLGSDLEILEQQVTNSRDLVSRVLHGSGGGSRVPLRGTGPGVGLVSCASPTLCDCRTAVTQNGLTRETVGGHPSHVLHTLAATYVLHLGSQYYVLLSGIQHITRCLTLAQL